MKIYTGRGDFGNTNVIGGGTVKKTDVIVKAYGEIDELNSQIGLLLAIMNGNSSPTYRVGNFSSNVVTKGIKNELKLIQNSLFDIGSIIADKENKMDITISSSKIKFLENSIDYYQEHLPELKYFVLPSGNMSGAQAHVIRTITRRVERSVLEAHEERSLEPNLLIYINRLSDYFFSLARMINYMGKIEDSYYTNTGEVFHN